MRCPADGRKCDCTMGSIKNRDCLGMTLEVIARLEHDTSVERSRKHRSAVNRVQASLTK